LHQEYPPVFRLDLHLPRQHRVTFEEADPQDVRNRINQQTSTLLQWFLLNQRDPHARQFKCVSLLCAHVRGLMCRCSWCDVYAQVLRNTASLRME
jgi:hypothetical protein